MTTYISPEKLEELRGELQERKGHDRREIAERIAQAKELGDLSENFEYHEAKDAQGMNEARVQELEDIIRNHTLIQAQQGADRIILGCKFNVVWDGGEKTFELVGANEADPMEGRISNESPLGNAFLGHRAGDVVETRVPSGVVRYTIVRIH